MVNKWLGQAMGTLLPYRCALCGLYSDRDIPLCTGCRGDLFPNHTPCSRCGLPLPTRQAPTAALHRVCGACLASPPLFDGVVAPWVYEDRVAYLIHQWKFRQAAHLTPLLATLWLEQVRQPGAVDVITPVPLHWVRRWRRGYNQADLLGRHLHHTLVRMGAASRYEPRLLRRTRATAPQSSAGATDRQRNLVGAFTVQRPCDNLRIALVDDVMTTAATAAETASALKRAGAREVQVWCLARTPTPGV